MSLIILVFVFLGSMLQGISLQNKWTSPNFSLFCIFGILLIIAAVYRPVFMPDYDSYFNAIVLKTSDRMEPTFYLIRTFWNILDFNPTGTFTTYALIGTSLVLFTIKRDSRYYWFSLSLFISIYFILGEMIQIRQAVAAGFLLLSTKYICTKNPKIYFLLTSFAILFHYSAIIMIPLYFLSPISKRRLYYICALILSFLLGNIIKFDTLVKTINVEFLSNIYYAKTALLDSFAVKPLYSNIRFILQMTICIFFWFRINSITLYLSSAIIYLKIYTLGLCIYLLFYNIPDVADRLSTMLLISEIILLPNAIRIIQPKWCSIFIISIICLKYFTSSISTYLLNGQ